MKNTASLFFLILCLLTTTFSYQNCTEIETATLSSKVEIAYLPLYTNQMKLFDGMETFENCKNTNEVLYSKSFNLCFEVNESCSYQKLIKQGFSAVPKKLSEKIDEAETFRRLASEPSIEPNAESKEPIEPSLESRISSCQISVDINDLKPNDFRLIKVSEAGYKPKKDSNCINQVEPMVNFKNRTCLSAKDGCQKSYLQSAGFVNDYFSICPQIL